MKTRRLCAVIAAAATLLGGMAFGTAGAYVAGSASIEVRHSQKGHTYSAYKFASLTVDGDAVQVDTDADWVTVVTDRSRGACWARRGGRRQQQHGPRCQHALRI